MFMYRLEIELSDRMMFFVVLSESDAKAFEYAENQLERHFNVKPIVKEMVILEKKRATKGSGYLAELKQG